MRVIAGTAGSIRLEAPRSEARPSSDRLREALFSMLAPRLPGAVVLDLFAGSGALGIEALSRGAARAVFVEHDRAAVLAINRNLERTKLTSRADVRHRDVWACLGELTESFDIIVADPPYAKHPGAADEAARLMQSEALPPRLAPGGVVVVEAASPAPLPALSVWHSTRVRSYGGSHLHLFVHETEGDSSRP